MTLLLANWKLIVIAALAVMLTLMTNLYIDTRDDLLIEKANFTTFVARVDELGKDAEDKKVKDEAEQTKNLEKVKADYEKQIPAIRARAVTNYLARVQHDAAENPGSGAVQGDGPGLRLDDGTSKECRLDEEFIQDAAEDADKLGAWQEYCRLNNCPVKE